MYITTLIINCFVDVKFILSPFKVMDLHWLVAATTEHTNVDLEVAKKLGPMHIPSKPKNTWIMHPEFM